MKKFLKLVALPASMFLLMGSVTSCSPSEKLVAMITDVGDIDDGGFNQGTWRGVKHWCDANNVSCDYYRPFADSEFALECAIKQAVNKKAKIIVLPGFKFCLNDFAYRMAINYPDVKFLTIDASTSKKSKNLIGVSYDFATSGWLAGYSVAIDYLLTDFNATGSIRDQYRFGFCGGMRNPGVYPFGLGYVQGIMYAMNEFTINKPFGLPKLYIDYTYPGVFSQDDGCCALVKDWLAHGNKCTFGCGGKLYQSVTEAVKEYNRHNGYSGFKDQEAPRDAARWVGVDADQYTLLEDELEKKSIYTSALKDIEETVKVVLNNYFSNTWDELWESPGSQQGAFTLGLKTTFGPEEHCQKEYNYVGLPEETKQNSNVMRSFNYFRLKKEGEDDLYTYEDKIEKLFTEDSEKKIVIYNAGFDMDHPGQFGEKVGTPGFFAWETAPEGGYLIFPEKLGSDYPYNGGFSYAGHYDKIKINYIE